MEIIFTKKRYNFYTCSNHQNMEFNIFPMFYSLHTTYTNISTIFGSAHNFLHKFKHQSLLIQKEKGKSHCAGAAGPLNLGPGRPTWLPRTHRLPFLSHGHWRAGPACQIRLPPLVAAPASLGTMSTSFRPLWQSVLASPPPCATPEALRRHSTARYAVRPHPWRTATSTARTPVVTSN